MQHIAIDLGSKESQLCVRDDRGTIVREERVATQRLKSLLNTLAPGRVIVETCAESLAIADAATTAGHEVRVVAGTLVRALGVGARGIKTDVRDARVLSEVSARIDLPSVHIPAAMSRERKAICTSREALVKTRTHLVNTTRGLLRAKLVRLRSGSVESFPKRVRERLLPSAEGMPAHIECLLKAIETMTEQISRADEELANIAKSDETCKRLMTVPGVGPVTSIRFVAAVDEVSRFKTAAKLESYLGLTPGEKTTGFKERRTRITKAGPSRLRHALGQASLSWMRARPNDPNVLWAKKVAERAGKQKAVVALARKMARILYAIWRDGSSYQPTITRSAEAAM